MHECTVDQGTCATVYCKRTPFICRAIPLKVRGADGQPAVADKDCTAVAVCSAAVADAAILDLDVTATVRTQDTTFAIVPVRVHKMNPDKAERGPVNDAVDDGRRMSAVNDSLGRALASDRDGSLISAICGPNTPPTVRPPPCRQGKRCPGPQCANDRGQVDVLGDRKGARVLLALARSIAAVAIHLLGHRVAAH